jgi:putative glutamine amidotransferase
MKTTTSSMKIGIAGLSHQTKNYENACISLGFTPCTSLSLAELGTCDGLILPGGSDITPGFYRQSVNGSRDINTELDLKQFQALDLFVRLGKPVLGICKGLQVINVFFGGTLIQDLPNSSAHQQEEGDLIHSAVITEDCLLSTLYGKEFLINSNHHQAVDKLGKDLKVVQMSRDGVVEAFRHTKLPIFAVQWHPERHKVIEVDDACINASNENFILSRENEKVSLPGNLILHTFFTNELIG